MVSVLPHFLQLITLLLAFVSFDQPRRLFVRQHLDLFPVPGSLRVHPRRLHAAAEQPHTHPISRQSRESDHLAERARSSGERIAGDEGRGQTA